MKTVKTVLELAADLLGRRGVKSSRLVADTLLASFLKVKRIDLYMQFDRPLQEEELVLFREAIKRAVTHEPIDYILGELEFYGCTIRVGPGVLIPRPETEILIEHIEGRLDGSEKTALDLCTGSGCIATALKTRQPDLKVAAVDLSLEALEIAKTNHSDVEWLKGDLTQPVQGRKFDLIVCNPPYVTSNEYEALDPSVRQFEPKIALVGGESGLEFYERLAAELPPLLASNAKVFFEIGTGQGEAVKALFSEDLYDDLIVVPDWAGHDRFFMLKVKENSSIMGSTHYV